MTDDQSVDFLRRHVEFGVRERKLSLYFNLLFNIDDFFFNFLEVNYRVTGVAVSFS